MTSSVDTLITKAVSPVILMTGIIGNIMNFVIIYRLRKQYGAFAYYFMVQIMTDFCVLTVTVFPRWAESLVHLHLELPVEGHWLCKIDAWILYSLVCVSAWLRAATSLQRMVGMVWPLTVGAAITHKLAMLIIVFIIVVVVSLQANILFGKTISVSNCYLGSTKSLDIHTVAGLVQTWLNFVITCAVPFTTIFMSNTALLHKLVQSDRAVGSKTIVIFGYGIFQLSKVHTITLTIMATALAYCLMLTPTYLLEALVVSGMVPGDQISVNTWSVLVLMILCNAAVNFFIHMGTGNRFRKEAKKLMIPYCRYKLQSRMNAQASASHKNLGGQQTPVNIQKTSAFVSHRPKVVCNSTDLSETCYISSASRSAIFETSDIVREIDGDVSATNIVTQMTVPETAEPVSQTSEAVSQTPEAVSQTPEAVSQTPKVVSQTLESVSQTSLFLLFRSWQTEV